MSFLEIRNATKSYGAVKVLHETNIAVEEGEFLVLVGPSGCGKSTTLRMIAGLEAQSGGSITIGGEPMADVPAGRRGVAMVFQNYALYPTMTVGENIEFGLRNIGVPKQDRRDRVAEIAETVGLTDHLRKRPSALSGGERQRVALARAMVKNPAVFLMDEPLSNLDARLRQKMRVELIELHERIGATFVYVTHDQVEAMSMGTDIVLMRDGAIMQQDAPEQLYRAPRNVFAGRFIGTPPLNVVPVSAVTGASAYAPTGAAWVGFRPERIGLLDGESSAPADAIELPASFIALENLGAEQIYRAELRDGSRVALKRFDEPVRELGSTVRVAIPIGELQWFDEREQRIAHAEVSG